MKKMTIIIFTIFLTCISLFAADVNVTHIPITKFSYPGRNITFRAIIKPVDTTVTSVTLMYKTAGEYNYTKFFKMTTNSSSTNYTCCITNREDTLNDIEYRMQIKYTNLSLPIIKLVPDNTDYYIDINPTQTGEISQQGGNIILPDDNPDDLKYTGLIVPSGALYKDEIFGIDTFEYGSIETEITKQNLIVKDNGYLNDGSLPVALYYFYKCDDDLKHNYAFREQVQIVLRYFDQDNDNRVDDTQDIEDNLGLFLHDGLKWRYMNSTLDTENNTLTSEAFSLGWFGLFNKNKEPSSGSSELIDYVSHPSFSPLNGEVVVFGIKNNIPDYTIKIIDFKGRIIRELNTNAWNGRDKNGEIVSSGVYVFQVIAGSKAISGMVCIVK